MHGGLKAEANANATWLPGPKHCSINVIVRHGLTKDRASLLINDIKLCLRYFQVHPVAKPMTEVEAGGFHHH